MQAQKLKRRPLQAISSDLSPFFWKSWEWLFSISRKRDIFLSCRHSFELATFIQLNFVFREVSNLLWSIKAYSWSHSQQIWSCHYIIFWSDVVSNVYSIFIFLENSNSRVTLSLRIVSTSLLMVHSLLGWRLHVKNGRQCKFVLLEINSVIWSSLMRNI